MSFVSKDSWHLLYKLSYVFFQVATTGPESGFCSKKEISKNWSTSQITRLDLWKVILDDDGLVCDSDRPVLFMDMQLFGMRILIYSKICANKKPKTTR